MQDCPSSRTRAEAGCRKIQAFRNGLSNLGCQICSHVFLQSPSHLTVGCAAESFLVKILLLFLIAFSKCDQMSQINRGAGFEQPVAAGRAHVHMAGLPLPSKPEIWLTVS